MDQRAQSVDGLLAGLTLDDGPGPARPLSEFAAAALVRGAFLAHAAPGAVPDATEPGAPGPRGGDETRASPLGQTGEGLPVARPGGEAAAWRRPLWQLAAGVLVLVLALGGALAAIFWPRPKEHQRLPDGAPRPAPAAAAPAPAPIVAAQPEAPVPASVEPPRPRPSSPEDLLRLANGRRRVMRFREADALYQQVLRSGPRSDAAYVARLASAALRLEHLRDARGALRLYDEALRLRPHGSLALEARRGVVECYRALGDRAAERRALRDLLEAQPDPDLRAWAEARLRTLAE